MLASRIGSGGGLVVQKSICNPPGSPAKKDPRRAGGAQVLGVAKSRLGRQSASFDRVSGDGGDG